MLPGQAFTRSRDSYLLWRDTDITFQNVIGGVPQVAENFTIGKSGEYSVILDNKTNNYKAARKAGLVIMNACKLTRCSRIVHPCTLSIDIPELGNVKRTCVGDLVYELENEVLMPTQLLRLNEDKRTNLINNALIQAHSKANEPAIFTGEFLADFASTIGMMRKPFAKAQDLINSLQNMKKNKRRIKPGRGRAAKSLEALSNGHLELSFGWAPLFSDIFKVAEMSSEKLGNERQRKVARSHIELRLDSKSEKNGATFWSNIETRVEMSLRYQATYSSGIVYEIVNRSKSADLIGRMGLRARDLPSTAWETVPLSWAIDYFLGVGNWLQAMTPNPEHDFRGSWVTETIRQHKETYLSNARWRSPSGVWKSDVGSPGFSHQDDQLFSRYVNLPLPSIPILSHELATNQTVNLLALTCQRIVRGLKSLR